VKNRKPSKTKKHTLGEEKKTEQPGKPEKNNENQQTDPQRHAQ